MANFHVNRWRDSTWWYYSKGWREDGTVMQIDTNFIADGFFYHDVKNWNFPDELYFWQRDSVSVLKMKTGNFTEGFQRKYYENGYLESETMDSAGMKNGEYKEWHVNGQLKLRQHFLKGKQTGKEEEWSDAANLVLEANWRNDSVIHRNQWNENGILFAAFDRPDKNDSVNFVEYSYDDSGKVVWIYKTFLNEGNEHSTYFYPDGKVKSDKAFYSKGFKGRGFDYQYDSTGKVSSGEISKVRLLCGKEVVKKYYPNGSRASKSKTRYRKKLGKRTDYETGREKIHFISWYPSGKKHVKEKYLSGENVFWDEYIYRGRKKVWDENGKMTEKRKLGDGDKPGNENDEEATSPRVKF
jgi:antitoxin component YwqK of YwqJK toxin-antitoxin module